MAVLGRLFLIVLAACYRPDLRDCTVTCAAQTDCADGLVCGADGFCAGPDVAGSCAHPDGGSSPSDAPLAIDAPSLSQLQVKIGGRGQVVVSGHGTCAYPSGSCTYAVPLAIELTLSAEPAVGYAFDRWGTACTGVDPTCAVTPSAPHTVVNATFRKRDD